MPNQLKLSQLAQLDVAAASGVVQREHYLYVVADDQVDLAVYAMDGARVSTLALSYEVLPEEAAARKAAKPDYESLLCLPDGSLLALGSGSTSRRMWGARVRFEADTPSVERIDLSELYAALLHELPELNIEGGSVLDGRLYLGCRGNGARGENALVSLDWLTVERSLNRERAIRKSAIGALTRVKLAELSGTPLSLTDLTVMDRGLVFSAAAEASASTYDDGRCVGSALGTLSTGGQVGELYLLSPTAKIEGICANSSHARGLFAVADADDPKIHSPLYEVSLPSR
jgi:hypothetical protein